MTIKKPILIAFLFCSVMSFAQKKIYLGASLNTEFLGDFNPRVGGGFTFERKSTERRGFEIGVFYRSVVYHTKEYEINLAKVSEIPITDYQSYLSFLLNHKRYSKFVNFSIGFNFDYCTGVMRTFNTPDKKFYFYAPYYSNTSGRLLPMKIGLNAKISKTFPLSNGFVLEPDLHFSAVIGYSGEPVEFLPNGAFYSGVGLLLKFDVSKIKNDEKK